MAIERLFSSRALYRTLALFFDYPEEPLNPRWISRNTGADMKGVLREIKKLEETGIIRGRRAGKFRLHELDRDHPAHAGLLPLFHAAGETRHFRFREPACPVWDDMTS